jgi:hypothetical protein
LVACSTHQPAEPPSPFAQVMALLMAQHPRLGVDSPAAKLTVDCAQRILLELTPAIVVDMGSALCKAGFVCGRERPSIIFPTINWEDAERVWHHLFFDQLHVRPNERSVLLIEPPLNPRANRERLAQLLFETFHVPALYVALGAELVLFRTGRATGVVVDSGEVATYIVPISEGFAIPHAIRRVDVAGRDVNRQLEQLLRKARRTPLPARLLGDQAALGDVVRDIKQRHAYVAPSSRFDSAWHEEMVLAATTEDGDDGTPTVPYPLPGGGVLELRGELCACAEGLFDTSAYGLADATLSAITACTVYEAEARNKLCANIVLSGGTTMCRGFAERLHEELAGLAPSAPIKVVHAAADGICASWAGGASFAAHPSFKDSKLIHRWIARKEYGAEPGEVL